MTGVAPKYRYYYSTLKYVHVRNCREKRALSLLTFDSPSNKWILMLSDVFCTRCPLVRNVRWVYRQIYLLPSRQSFKRLSGKSSNPLEISRAYASCWMNRNACWWLIWRWVSSLHLFSFFQVPHSGGFGRYRSNLNSKTKEALERISQVTQERLESDRLQVSSMSKRTVDWHQCSSDSQCSTSFENCWTSHVRWRTTETTTRKTSEDGFCIIESIIDFFSLGQSSGTSVRDTPCFPRYAKWVSITRRQNSFYCTQFLVAIEILPQLVTQQPSTSTTTETIVPKTPSSPSISLDASATSQPSPHLAVNEDRNPLLTSINAFNISVLKKTKTNDRSSPLVKWPYSFL